MGAKPVKLKNKTKINNYCKIKLPHVWVNWLLEVLQGLFSPKRAPLYFNLA